jgi:hypothetical protein
MSKKLSNEFSYSFSRYNTFSQCKRQYFLNYYGYWNGWRSESPERKRRTYWLKKLTSMWAWTGNIVHEEVAKIFRDIDDKQPVILQRSIDRARREMTRQFRISEVRPVAKCFGLKEHEYDLPIPKDNLRDRVIVALTNFYCSGVIEMYKKLDKKDILSVEELTKFPLKFDDFTVNVYAVPDFAYRRGDEVVIWDWKTGNPDPHYSDQIALYSLYANSYWDVKPEKVETNIFYLKTGEVVQKWATKEWIEEARLRVERESKEMLAYVDNIDSNRALPEEDFPLTEDTNGCRWCNFEEICGIQGRQGGSS